MQAPHTHQHHHLPLFFACPCKCRHLLFLHHHPSHAPNLHCPHHHHHHHHHHGPFNPIQPLQIRGAAALGHQGSEKLEVSTVKDDDSSTNGFQQQEWGEDPELEDEDKDDVFVLTDEWKEFFAKSEAKRRLEKKRQRNKGRQVTL